MSRPGGWLEPVNRKRLEVVADLSDSPRPFWELYRCPDPKDMKTMGFKSWDAFFTREFHHGVRPVYKGEDADGNGKLPPIMLHACESKPLKIAYNVQAKDAFWLKEQPCAMLEMLDNHPLATRFVDGVLYQAYLSALSYYRWHAPVTGKVIGVQNVDGRTTRNVLHMHSWTQKLKEEQITRHQWNRRRIWLWLRRVDWFSLKQTILTWALCAS